ncbi:VOC family protein [Ornithinibacillus massiliensis]|uniref:VOC family protein n=1 Tax=Ornithinibacillus massiliensis TaxID=1944633 RepID=A0ABS5MI72_9BACI|nr:VOC family protein [Ornithinibacillus massiliensis]MBS3681830.1 VOC family protein [Ornithinibacillus massiliensis]
MEERSKPILGKTIQVRLVSDLKRSLRYYRDVLGCKVDNWGHAERDEFIVILQQSNSEKDVRPNAISKKRSDYPTEWEGPDFGWDTYIHISWDDLDSFIEEVRGKGGTISVEPFIGKHGKWEFKNAYIEDPDGYNIVLGSMREIV